jgi:prepilin-type processing-associated H-X9-DG protein
MRRSLILSAFLAVQATLSVGLVIPSTSWEDLERRGPDDIKKSSSTYREAAKSHGSSYDKSPGGKSVIKTELTPAQVEANKKDKTTGKGKQADHVLEAQTVSQALKNSGHTFGSLPSPVKKDIKDAVNSKSNMAFVDGSVNSQKGQATKSGQKGVPGVSDRPARDSYMEQSYGTGKKTAERVDKAIDKGLGPNAMPQGSVKDTFRAATKDSGALKRNHSPPTSSSSGSPGSSPPAKQPQKKTKT